jgi:hypothetical protein
MSTTSSKVLTGCGIGCLLAIVLVVGFGWMGYRWARLAADAVESTGQTEARLEERFGPVRDFRPPIDAQIPADRLEAFLVVRESLAAPRAALEEAISGLAPGEGEGGMTGGLRTARAGAWMAPRALDFARARNESLLSVGMGFGEYTWVYWLIYDAWLGNPADASTLHDIMAERATSDGSVQMHFGGGMEPERISWRLRRDITAMLRNLEEDLAADNEPSGLRELVSVELQTLEADPARIPWEDGLPEEFAVGLESYRDRLESTYSAATNPFELLELD